jgi:hypothetical protein
MSASLRILEDLGMHHQIQREHPTKDLSVV